MGERDDRMVEISERVFRLMDVVGDLRRRIEALEEMVKRLERIAKGEA